MSIRSLKTICLFCAIGTMTLTTTLSAQQTKPNYQPQEGKQIALSDRSEACFAELQKTVDLNAEQSQKIHEIYLQSEVAQKVTWQKFTQAQLAAIRIEAEMYATMEAGMTDSQKQTFTSARVSQREKTMEGSNTPHTTRKIRETSGRTNKDGPKEDGKSDLTLNKSVNGQIQDLEATPSESFVQAEIITPMKKVVVSLGMDSDESEKCKSVCHVYHTRLNAAWTEVNRLRNELVTQEANTIKSIAKVLTKEQVSKLEKQRAIALKTEASDSNSDR